ncbi:DUF4328 domain-containing protein [Streptomyces sp. A7024]|uniref:DUF4328 domain-containing protein n=1 Tax=Streptomyces coryli TaxID=1128680 RepID=A0A6G4U380_9ACTN|nr:DUF4328 domain-containing protein [Streptomyces coryli]
MYGATGLLQWLALLATAAVFIIWFHRTRENAELFNAGELRHSSGWAVGAWFIPFANLWIPKKIANDIWQASAPPPDFGSRRPAGVGLVTAWWALWVTNLLVERLASRVYLSADDPTEVKSAVGLLTLSDTLDILAAVLAIVYVRKLSAMQSLKHIRSAQPVG